MGPSGARWGQTAGHEAVWPLAGARRACYGARMTDLTDLQERIAHLTRAVEDLSDAVARQDRELAALSRRAELLMQREAERQAEAGAVPLADRPPPHW